jgi:hypothetical protein
VTYLIEYWGEFEFIFEIILDYESGDQMGSFDAKNHHRKSHAWAPLKAPYVVTSDIQYNLKRSGKHNSVGENPPLNDYR